MPENKWNSYEKITSEISIQHRTKCQLRIVCFNLCIGFGWRVFQSANWINYQYFRRIGDRYHWCCLYEIFFFSLSFLSPSFSLVIVSLIIFLSFIRNTHSILLFSVNCARINNRLLHNIECFSLSPRENVQCVNRGGYSHSWATDFAGVNLIGIYVLIHSHHGHL